MLAYAEAHPGEVVGAQEELSRRAIARLIRDENALRRATKSPSRYRVTRQELAETPF
jgi:hypothetical protein